MNERVLIVGHGSLARAIVDAFDSRPEGRHGLLGAILEDDDAAPRAFDCPILGGPGDLGAVVARERPDRIVFAVENRQSLPPVDLLAAAWAQHRITVESGAEAYERLTGKLPIEAMAATDLIFSRAYCPAAATIVTARTISLIGATLGLLLLWPLMLIVAVAIKLDSPGPALFIQERIGLRGRRFSLFKFRSMHVGDARQSQWARDNADRITRIGAWLRKYRLDELPQLINVIRGDMNLVGPRPHPACNFELFVLVSRNMPHNGDQIPFYFLRSAVRPGITGWAQVRYKYANDIDEELEKLRYDLYYVKHCSLLLDLRILLETIGVVALGDDTTTTAPLAARSSHEASRP